MKQPVDLLVLSSKETVTVDPGLGPSDLGIIDDGGVAIRGGKILEAASSQKLERKYEPKKTLDASNQMILPGFVDPHTHLVFDGSREDEFQLRIQGVQYLEVLRGGRGILETVNKTRQASSEQLFQISFNRLDTALEAGTTTVEVKSGYGLRLYDELKILKTINRLKEAHPCRIAPTFLGAHAIPPECSDPEVFMRMVVEEMLPEVVKNKLASFCDVFCEKGAFDAKQSERVLRAASRTGLRTKIHADEFSDSGGAGVANRVSATSADHLVNSPHKELQAMEKTLVTPVLLPASSHSLLTNQYAPARDMSSMGLQMALGTDFSPANWVLGQLAVAAIAAREMRMSAGEILRGITINAARALALEDTVGSISPGKSADLVIMNAPNHRWVGYTYGENVVDKVLIRGEVVVSDGKRVK